MSPLESPQATANGVLPPVSNGIGRDTGGGLEQGAAWQREMERAQMTAWFKASVVNPPSHAMNDGGVAFMDLGRGSLLSMTSGGMPGVIDATQIKGDLAAGSYQSDVGRLPRAMGGGKPAPVTFESMPSAAIAAASKEARHTAGRGLAVPAGGHAAQGAVTMGGVAALFKSESEALTTPVRIHLEASLEGIALWLAVREGDTEAQSELPKVLADIERWLGREGLSLCQVVCNGRLLWRGDAPTATVSRFPEAETQSLDTTNTTYGSWPSPIDLWRVPYGD